MVLLPRAGAWRRRALGYAPFALRRAVLARREAIAYPWLRPAGRRGARERAAGAERAVEPRTVSRRMAWYRAMRATATGTASLAAIAGDDGRPDRAPAARPHALGRRRRRRAGGGFARRDDVLRLAARDLLPDAVLGPPRQGGLDRSSSAARPRVRRRLVGHRCAEALVDAAVLRGALVGQVPAPTRSHCSSRPGWQQPRGRTGTNGPPPR